MSKAVYRLYHHPLDAPSRRVRLAFAEKGIAFDSAIEKPWEPTDGLLALCPSGALPALTVDGGENVHVLSDAGAICEYLEETHAANGLLGRDLYARAEVRRLVGWFEGKFRREVTDTIVFEKAFKRLSGEGEPQSNLIRMGCANVRRHLDYIGELAEQRNWLAGEAITYADLAAAAQLSVVDYMGDVPWSHNELARDWYARIKSRPSFRALLGDHIAGFPPPRHYADLDF